MHGVKCIDAVSVALALFQGNWVSGSDSHLDLITPTPNKNNVWHSVEWFDLVSLAPPFRPTGSVVGVDMTDEQLETARTHNDVRHCLGMALLQCAELLEHGAAVHITAC